MKKRVDMNFKVSAQFRYAFNNHAARQGISGKELLERVVALWVLLHPDDLSSIEEMNNQRVSSMTAKTKLHVPAIMAEKMAALGGDISIDQIANDLGYRSADFLRSIVVGEVRFPLDAVEKFAAVLGIDLVELTQAALSDWGLDGIAALLEPKATPEELELIRAIRRLLKANG